MKHIFSSLACLAVVAAAAMPASAAQKTTTLYFSQGFQGPEKWEKAALPVDSKGAITIFNGKDYTGWRGYASHNMPSKWKVEDGCIKFDSQAQGTGGDIIFAHKFKNFELTFEWKIEKGGNSGVFYLGQEAALPNGQVLALYESAAEYQILDNANHPDAKLGHDGNRMSASLYDLIPAKPQNQKPYGNWNVAKIVVNNGHVEHWQNGVKVLEYNFEKPEWVEMLRNSKFGPATLPNAFNLMQELGGEQHEGFIGLQDHGNTVWYRNIKVRPLK